MTITEKETKTASREALKRLEEEELEAVRKYFRIQKQLEREAREWRKRHLLRVYG